MPKLSVYVPDELWEQAKGLPGFSSTRPNNSHVVQQALEHLVSEQSARRAAFATGAARDAGRVAAVVEQLRDDATREFERGYSAGLDLAEILGFDELRMEMNAGGLDNAGGITWLGEMTNYVEGLEDWWQANAAAFSPKDEILSRNEPFHAGATQALEDVWQALRENTWGTSTGEAESVDEGDKTEGGTDE